MGCRRRHTNRSSAANSSTDSCAIVEYISLSAWSESQHKPTMVFLQINGTILLQHLNGIILFQHRYWHWCDINMRVPSLTTAVPFGAETPGETTISCRKRVMNTRPAPPEATILVLDAVKSRQDVGSNKLLTSPVM